MHSVAWESAACGKVMHAVAWVRSADCGKVMHAVTWVSDALHAVTWVSADCGKVMHSVAWESAACGKVMQHKMRSMTVVIIHYALIANNNISRNLLHQRR